MTLQRMCQSFYLILRDTSLTSRSLESSASICTQVCVRVSLPGVQLCSQQGAWGWALALQTERVREGGVWEAPGGDVSCYFGFAGPSFSFRDL